MTPALIASPLRHMPEQEIRSLHTRLARRFRILAGLWAMAFVAVSAVTLIGMSAAHAGWFAP
jgi:hypothetical protein